MTNTQQFIEDAIKGDYIYAKEYTDKTVEYLVKVFSEQSHKILLDPSAWQAVSKVRGWKKIWRMDVSQNGFDHHKRYEEWQYNMHRFLDLFIEGKDYETALSEIK